MPKLIIVGTHGTDDPTRASMPFHIAKGAREAGYEVGIVLANDAPLLMKDTVRETVQGVGMPALRDLFQFAVSNQVRVYIWGGCAKAREVLEADLQGKNAEFIDPKRFAQLTMESDKVLSFWEYIWSSTAKGAFGAFNCKHPWSPEDVTYGPYAPQSKC